MEEVITEVMVSTDAMVIEAIEGSGLVQTDAHEEQFCTLFSSSFCNRAKAQFCNDILNVNDSASFVLMFKCLNGVY